MKYSFLCTVIFCFLNLSTLNSQISVGASSGITFSHLDEFALNSGLQSHELNGFRVNIISNYRLNTRFSVQSELGYMRKSGEIRGTENLVNNVQDIGLKETSRVTYNRYGKDKIQENSEFEDLTTSWGLSGSWIES